MMIEQQSQRSASPTGLALYHSGEERMMQEHTIHPRGYFEPRCARCCADRGVAAAPISIRAQDLPSGIDLQGHRAELARREYNSYDPEHFPGSKGWMKNHEARKALAAFDLAHPEIVAANQAARITKQAAEYEGLSDFVKGGS